MVLGGKVEVLSGIWWSERGGAGAVPHCDLVEPAASWRSRWLVETGDIRLEVDDRCLVEKVNAGEGDDRAIDAQQPDEAETDRIDPPWSPGGEHANDGLLAAQQERHLAQRRVGRGCQAGGAR